MFGFQGEELAVFILGGGLLSMVIPLMLCWIVGFFQWCYAWVDDSKVGYNPLTVKLCELTGYSQCDKDMAYIKTVCVFFFLPLALSFPYLLLTIVVGIVIAHLARMCFRHRKLFDKHIKDVDAHKK